VFDRTFMVTRVLRWLTVGVAFVGIFSALLALHLERAREFAIIRATGATRLRIISVVLLQTFLMGVLAGLLALPLGWIMSELLIKVINVRSFGWSMQSMLPAGSIPETLILACLSAMLAGIYPALRLSRSNIAAQLRDD
jgi:putative ABC transport system permease protein